MFYRKITEKYAIKSIAIDKKQNLMLSANTTIKLYSLSRSNSSTNNSAERGEEEHLLPAKKVKLSTQKEKDTEKPKEKPLYNETSTELVIEDKGKYKGHITAVKVAFQRIQ